MNEKKAMQSVANSFFAPTQMDYLKITKDLDKILSVLHYGYGARTRKVIEENFPRFKNSLSVDQWLELGSRFSYQYALLGEQLGLIPRAFASWVITDFKKLLPEQRFFLLQDEAYFEVRHEYFEHRNLIRSPAEILENSSFTLQSSMRIVEGSKASLIISRNRKSFFEVGGSDKEIAFILQNSGRQFKADSLETFFVLEEDLVQFISRAIKNCWLSRS